MQGLFDTIFGLSDKAIIRAHAKRLRDEAAMGRRDAGVHAAANFMRAISPEAGSVVAVYYSIGSELDTKPLADALLAAGVRVALPVITAKAAPLVFRQYQADMELVDGKYGIAAPPDHAPLLTPDIVVCPLLAFSPDGVRLGMGGGFYDRTLAALRAQGAITAIGYGYAAQENAQLVAEKHDQPMDWIVTEREAFRTSRHSASGATS